MRIKITEDQYAIINGHLSEDVNISEEETRTLKIPKIEISKRTAEGSRGSAEAREVEKFIKTLKGKTIKGFFNNLLKEAASPQTPEKMVSTLLILDLLRKVNEDFDRSAGGFLFEYLIAPIIGGTGVPTKTDLSAKIQAANPNFKEGLAMAMKSISGRVEDISDVMSSDGQIGYSIKNLSESSLSKGSIMNLLGSLYAYDDIKFFVAYRIDNGDIHIYEVSLGNKDNPAAALNSVSPKGFIEFLNEVKDIEKNSNDLTPDEIAQQIVTAKNNYDSEKTQFYLPKKVLNQEKNTIARIPMSQIDEIEKRIVEKLNESIFNIYDDLDSLARNLNTFYTESKEEAKKKAGKGAIKDADNLSCEVNATAGKGGKCSR